MKSNIKFSEETKRKTLEENEKQKFRSKSRTLDANQNKTFKRKKTNILEENQTILEGNLNINMERN